MLRHSSTLDNLSRCKDIATDGHKIYTRYTLASSFHTRSFCSRSIIHLPPLAFAVFFLLIIIICVCVCVCVCADLVPLIWQRFPSALTILGEHSRVRILSLFSLSLLCQSVFLCLSHTLRIRRWFMKMHHVDPHEAVEIYKQVLVYITHSDIH